MVFGLGIFKSYGGRQQVLPFGCPVILVVEGEPDYARFAAHVFHYVYFPVEQVVGGPCRRKHPECGPCAAPGSEFRPHLYFPVSPALERGHAGGDVFLVVERSVEFVGFQYEVAVPHHRHSLSVVGFVDVVLRLVVAPAGASGLELPCAAGHCISCLGVRLVVELVGPDQTVFSRAFVLLAGGPPVGFLEVFRVSFHAPCRSPEGKRQEQSHNYCFLFHYEILIS